jgi:hypothetical protein
MEKQKDAWDKLDVIGKLLSGFVLAGIAIIIGIGSEKITNALKKGSLVQSLITDLTNGESTTRQDVALIALHHSVGKEDSVMVAEIAERIFYDLKNSDSSLGGIAFKILKERKPSRAKEIEENIQLKLSAPGNRSQNISAADTSLISITKTEPSASGLLAARIFDTLVYIQFRGSVTREKMNELRNKFLEKGYNAPGVERIDGNFKNWVRYFHPEDKELAERVAGLAKEFIGKDIEFSLQDLSGMGHKAQVGLIELWINFDSKAP